MDEQLMLDTIDAAEGVEYIGFSGGEPFLEYKLLLKGVTRAKERGHTVTIATNGFWGAWPRERIEETLHCLKPNIIFISTDYYHAQYVSEAVLAEAVSAAKSMGIRTELSIGETKEGISAAEYFKSLGTYKYLTNYTIYPFVRAGRAAALPDEAFIRPVPTQQLYCAARGMISVRYDGQVFPCCEQLVFDTAMSLGNVKNSTIKDLLAAEDNNVKLSVIKAMGFDFLMDSAKESLGLDFPSECSKSCEICGMLFKNDEDVVQRLNEWIAEEYGRLSVDKLLMRA
jgi:MoaA/NifB/PqqE/SkfB family radical SAM enzyme